MVRSADERAGTWRPAPRQRDGGPSDSTEQRDTGQRDTGQRDTEECGGTQRGGTHGDSAWLRLLERVVGGWAPTLRGSLVLLALFLCAMVLLVVALGVTGVLISAALAGIGYWLNAAGRPPRA